MVYVGNSWTELDYWTSPFGDYDARLRVLAYSTQSITDNTSTVYFKLQKRITGGYYAESYNNLSFEISGTGKKKDTHSATQTWVFGHVTSTSWTDVGGDTHDMYWGNVKHNDDGTCTLTATAEGDRILGGSFDTDISITLPTIPRASSPTVTPNPQTWSDTDPNTITVTTNRKSSSFTHTVRCEVWSYSDNKTGVGANTTFTIPYSTLASMPMDQNSFTGSVYTQTKSGSTNIGSEIRSTWTIKVDPSIEHANIGNITIRDMNPDTHAITQDDTVYIANISTLASVINVSTSGNYTQLKTVKITCGSNTVTHTFDSGTTSATIPYILEGVNSDHLTVVATDWRGNSVTGTKTWTLIEYQPLTINTATVTRPSATGSTGVGQISGMAYGGSFGQTPNELTVYAYFKRHDEDSYDHDPDDHEEFSIALPTAGFNPYANSEPMTFQFAFDYRYQYDVKFVVRDLFSSAEYTAQLMQGLPILSWDENEVDIFGDLHIHDREDPYKYQNVLDGFDAVLETNGHKNLITMTTPTKTENGVTFTHNGSYYNVNGTATSNAFCNATTDVPMVVGRKYILSGLHDEYVRGMQVVVRYVANTDIIAIAEEDDVEFTCPAPCYAYLVVKTGTTVSNKHWYPMIRDARIASEEYVRGSMGVNVVTASGSWTNSSSVQRNYRIFGQGFVVAAIWCKADSVSDTGSCTAWIDVRNSSSVVCTLSQNTTRLSSAATTVIRATANGVYYYDGSSSADRLRLYADCTKNGTNTWYLRIMTIGCTVQAI